MMMNGELAGFTIPRLGMGTMALAIEGRPDRDTAIRTIHAGLDAGAAIWTRLGHIICRASPAPALRKTLATVKSWCVMRSLRGMAPEMQCSSPRKLAIDAPWRSPLLLLLCPILENRTNRVPDLGHRCPIHQNRTLRGGILRDAAVGLARNASICRRRAVNTDGWRIRAPKP